MPGTPKTNTSNNQWDVVVVGGSYAGLSAAMTLGRSVRPTLVIDSGAPCNQSTPHTHNFITQDGVPPAALAQRAREQVLHYPTVTVKEDRVVEVQGDDHHFRLRTEAGDTVHAKKVLFATGVNDIMPAIPGFAACWGISVIHCPYCHGYEVKEKPTGILTNGEAALDFGRLISHWTDDLTIFTDGEPTFDVRASANVNVVDRKIARIEHQNGYIKQLTFQDGSSAALDALYARPAFRQHCDIPEKLGCQLTEPGHIEVDSFQKTSVPGVYAAGDNTDFARAVSVATAAGTKAGASINHALIQDETYPR